MRACALLLVVVLLTGLQDSSSFSLPRTTHRTTAVMRSGRLGTLLRVAARPRCCVLGNRGSRGRMGMPPLGSGSLSGQRPVWFHGLAALSAGASDSSGSVGLSENIHENGQGGSERNVVVVCHDVGENIVRGAFRPNNLLEGRVDVMCRCITAALYCSRAIRKDTRLWLVLQPQRVVVSVNGGAVEGLNPDEKTVALFLQRALEIEQFVIEMKAEQEALAESASVGTVQGQEQDTSVESFFRGEKKRGSITKSDRNLARKQRERRRAAAARWETGEDGSPLAPPGFDVHRDTELKDLLARLTRGHGDADRVLWLHEDGTHIGLEAWPGTGGVGGGVIVVGDQLGYTEDEEILLGGLARVKKVSLGSRSLLASQCIVLIHHYLDGDHRC